MLATHALVMHFTTLPATVWARHLELHRTLVIYVPVCDEVHCSAPADLALYNSELGDVELDAIPFRVIHRKQELCTCTEERCHVTNVDRAHISIM